MKQPSDSRPRLDEVNAAIRSQHLDSEAIAASATAVWRRLEAELDPPAAASVPAPDPATAPAHAVLHGCPDIRALAPAYRRGELSANLRLLFEDHLAHCVSCRAACAGRPAPEADITRRWAAAARAPHGARHPYRWAAAALAVAAAIAVAIIYVRVSPASGQATVLAAAGPVYELEPSGPVPVRAHWLAYGPNYRNTAQTQLRLPDGSRLDLRAHSEFSLAGSPHGAQLRLIAGDVIVEAAPQHGGRHLEVQSPSALVTSLGTIFAVQQGLKGARVAVLRDSVRVSYNGQQAVVPAGGQLSTNPNLQVGPLASSFSWGANAPQYMKLIASLAKLRQDLATVPPPALRYGSGLARLLPANTVFFASLPNLHGQLEASYQILQQQLAQDPVLRQWWQRHNGQGGKFATTVEPFLQLAGDLGPEIVLGGGPAPGQPSNPILLARVTDPADFAQRLARLPMGTGGRPRLIQTSRLPARLGRGPVIWMHDGLLAAALEPATLRALQHRLDSPGFVPFTATPFYARIASTYAAGVSLLVAADLRALLGEREITGPNPKLADTLARLGVMNATALIATSRQAAGQSTNRAVLAFNSQRRGIAAWLAPPRPMETLSYVSPEARTLVAASTIPPADLAAQINALQTPGTGHQPPPEWLLNLLNPLTGEFAAALDGPLLPAPNWVVAVGVNDPQAMQNAIASALGPLGGGAITPITVNGQDAYRLALPFGFTAVYMYTGGDLVAASSSAWLTQALRFHSSGYNLLHSRHFLSALPVDDQANCSAIFYQNLGPTLDQLLSLPGASALGPAQRDSISNMVSQAPTAVCAYAAPEQITVAMNGKFGPLDFLERSLLGLHDLPLPSYLHFPHRAAQRR